MGKKKYVTDDYIEKVQHYLYNDLPLKELYTDVYTSDFNQKVVDSLIMKREKYVRLEGDLDHVVITSFGRLINTKRISQYSLRFTAGSIVCYVCEKKIVIPAIFEREGWEYNFNKILNNYRKYNWTFQDTTKYKFYANRNKPKKKRVKST